MMMIMYGRNDDDDGDLDVVAHLFQQLVLFHDRYEDDDDDVAHLLKQLVLPPLTFGLKSVERLPDVVDLVFH